jgi:DNA-binding CsgD family transcriptional regulator
MLTMHDDDESIFGAVRAGALGYVLKGADSDDLLRAIAAVAAGEAIFGPGLARRALQALSAPREPAFAELTRREREVLELIASGMSNPGIAAKLGLSPNTVSNHISSIFSKLQVGTRCSESPACCATWRDGGNCGGFMWSEAIDKPWWRSRGRSAVVGSERLAGVVDSGWPAFRGPTRRHRSHGA